MKQKIYLHWFFLILTMASLSIVLVDICAIVFSLNGMDAELGRKIIYAFWYTIPLITLCFLLVTRIMLKAEGGYFFVVEDEHWQRKLNVFQRIWCTYVPIDWFFEIVFYEIICSTSLATRVYVLSCSRAFFAVVIGLFCGEILDLSGNIDISAASKRLKRMNTAKEKI